MHPVISHKNKKRTVLIKVQQLNVNSPNHRERKKNQGEPESFCLHQVTLHIMEILSVHPQLPPSPKIRCCKILLR